ncbi:MAG TPA: hypothetical protein VGF46_07410 [Gaiellales bacterium]|jgi:hypothetical protein
MGGDPLGLFVFEDGEASVFWSFDEAARSLDADDVRAGAYQLFTVDGRVVEALADGARVELVVTAERAEQALVEQLRMICGDGGIAFSADDLPGAARELYRRDW